MKPNSNVERIAQSIAIFILILGIIAGISLICIGIEEYNDATKATQITGGIVAIISSVIFWVFVNLLVNISLKLDRKDTTIANQSMRETTETLSSKSEDNNKPNMLRKFINLTNQTYRDI